MTSIYPITLAQARATVRKLVNHKPSITIHDAEDVLTLSWLEAQKPFTLSKSELKNRVKNGVSLELKILTADEIISHIINNEVFNLQHATVCQSSFENEDGDDFNLLDNLEGPSLSDADVLENLPKSKTATDEEIAARGGPSDWDNFRINIKGKNGKDVCDARQRQLIAKLAAQFTSGQGSIFNS